MLGVRSPAARDRTYWDTSRESSFDVTLVTEVFYGHCLESNMHEENESGWRVH